MITLSAAQTLCEFTGTGGCHVGGDVYGHVTAASSTSQTVTLVKKNNILHLKSTKNYQTIIYFIDTSLFQLMVVKATT